MCTMLNSPCLSLHSFLPSYSSVLFKTGQMIWVAASGTFKSQVYTCLSDWSSVWGEQSRAYLMKMKNKMNMDKVRGVVYRMDCECGHTYFGETGRTMEARMKEHKWAVRCDDVNNGIAVHTNNTRHSIRWESAQVVEVQNWSKRRTKEALHIRDLVNTMNLDKGHHISPTWSTLHPFQSLSR